MSVNVNVDSKNPPTVSLLTINHLKKNNAEVKVTEGNATFIALSDFKVEGDASVSRYLARMFPTSKLYGSSPLESSQVDSWIDFSTLHLRNAGDTALNNLNTSLAPSTYLVGNSFTLADFSVWAALKGNSKWESTMSKNHTHIFRWFNFCSAQDLFKTVQLKLPAPKANAKGSDSKKGGLKSTLEEGGKFFDLPGAEKGKVVVRFPPEASGYLHIGHAKAALMNQYYKELYDGKLVMRFDDTNPAKENAHYEQIILEDIKLLHLTPDLYSRTSDHFDLMLKYAEQMITSGNAYCDNTPAEEVKQLREERLPSPNRDLSVEENLRLFNEMKSGTEVGMTYCLRAKIDHTSDNGCLRDPVMYRCRSEAHLVHGNKYVAYPTYDFACPIVDSVEGVTHALRTSEYLDRDTQYYWFIEKLGIRKPYIYSYSRLNLVNTVLSKRKLTYLVDEGFVDGWDDARFPTVRGVIRRGMSIRGLKEFIVAQGSSKANVHMEWDKIWAFNKKIIDPEAPRFNALLTGSVVPVVVHGVTEAQEQYPKHPKNESVGKKPVYYSSKVFVEGEDAALMKENDLVTFINWGNLRIAKVNKQGDNVTSLEATLELDNKDFKKTSKVTWLAEHSAAPFTKTQCVYFDDILTKDLTRDDDFKDHIKKDTKHVYDMMGDPCLAEVKKGDIIQLQRRGYFICDEPYQPASRHSGVESPCILYHIPDGSTTGLMNQSTKATKSSSSSSSSSSKGNSKKQAKGQQQQPAKQQAATLTTSSDELLSKQVTEQGDKIRKLKLEKASKEAITAEVNILKELKAKYKTETGVEYAPPSNNKPPEQKAKQDKKPAAKKVESISHTPEQQTIYDRVTAQGDKIRALKSTKPSKEAIVAEVTVLKELKAEYKQATGIEYQANMAPTATTPVATTPSETGGDEVAKKIVDQGDKIRQLKSAKTSKEDLQPEIDRLLALKAEYKTKTGEDYKPPGGGRSEKKAPAKEKAVKKETKKEKPAKKEKTEDDAKKQTRLGLEATKEGALSDWYSQVITKSELIEYYDVSGCYILRPWAYAIWETIKEFFDQKIKASGVSNCYFPMFVSQAALEKEKDHIEDFAPEVAWVTRSGQSELAEPIAIRPTSETVMYPAYAKWIQSHRDLPLRLNQWCNVVRWEFKHPQPFLRTREFLWQEGHTAYDNQKDAVDEVHEILGYYSQVYTDLLAIPVVKGRKTEKEKFAGGDFTTTVEAFISASGRAIQGATSHHLGQNFSKMFNIVIEDPKGESKEKLHVYQNSWGLTTRTIGVMVMVHGDNKGLVLPPRVSSVQVIIVPVGITATTTDDKRKEINDCCGDYHKSFSAAGIRSKLDDRDNVSPGWKFNHWELKGVPLRVEVGPRDLKNNEFVVVRRDTGEKASFKKDGAEEDISKLLETIQADMFERASDQLNSALTVVKTWEEFNANLDKNQLVQAPFCGGIKCEETIKKESAREEAEEGAPSMGAKSLCVPFDQPAPITDEKCVHPCCGKPAISYTLFGRSY